MNFTWTPEHALGHERIDDDHRHLFALAAKVVEVFTISTDSQQAQQAFDALLQFARTHFALEENLMQSAGYPDFAHHANVHNALLHELITAQRRLQKGLLRQPKKLTSFLLDWLTIHMDLSERELVEFLNRPAIHANAPKEGALPP